MSLLRVVVQSDHWQPGDTALPAEILDRELVAVAQGAVPLWGEWTVDLAPGSYLVRAALPSGETLRSTIELKLDVDATVELPLPASRHEWLAFATLLGVVPPAARYDAAPSVGDTGELHLRTWERSPHDPTWREGGWTLDRVNADEQVALHHASGSPELLRMLELEGPGVPTRFIAVPPTPRPLEVLLQHSEHPQRFDGGLTVDIVTVNGSAEALLRYLTRGSFDAAIQLGRDRGAELDDTLMLSWLDDAERFARTKLYDPAAAAVGFYFMLRTGADDRMHDWPANYARWLDWIPDGPVIRAWQLLRRPNAERHLDEAASLLVEASVRGVPVYSEGLRLLQEGLELVASYAPTGAIADAHARVRSFAAAADLTQPLTTFLGTGPDDPAQGSYGRGVDADSGALRFAEV